MSEVLLARIGVIGVMIGAARRRKKRRRQISRSHPSNNLGTILEGPPKRGPLSIGASPSASRRSRRSADEPMQWRGCLGRE
jgi:hypothetical protein